MQNKFKRFCYGTSIHGFVELHSAKQKIWTGFWMVVLTCAFSMTIYHVVCSTHQFFNQTTVTKVEIVSKKHLLYPSLKACLCHWAYWVDPEIVTSMNVSYEVFLYAMSYLGKVYSSFDFDVDEAEKQFFDLASRNNFTQLSQFLNAIKRKTFFLMDPFERDANFFDSELYYGEWNLINCYIVPGEDIKSYIYDNKTVSTKFTSETMITLTVPDQTFSTFEKYFTLEEYGNYLSDWLVRPIKNVDSFENLTLPWLLMPNGYNPRESVVIQYEYDYVEVKLTASVKKWKPTRSNPCKDVGKTIKMNNTCFERCRIKYKVETQSCPLVTEAISIGEDYFEKLCPDTIVFLNGNKKYEREQKNTSKQINLETVQSDLRSCLQNCVRTCETWTYTYTSSFTNYGADDAVERHNSTDIYLYYPSPDDIIIMTQLDSQSWEDFVANIGGLLGVWTGASLLSIIQLVYLCFFASDSNSSIP